ncbi:hypothetical protein CspHIS471_0312580 [Cutaneotrichosporon sp. HIS471]|nr:hypothetical protein CspHIS471_0312580 [Cutaneotrichosporon sp. HIS471]
MSTDAAAAKSATTAQFTSGLVIGAVTIGVCFVFWGAFHARKNLIRVFQPRIELGAPDKRPEKLPNNPLGWWKTIFQVRDEHIITVNGPDAYFAVRYLKIFGVCLLAFFSFLSLGGLVAPAVVKPNNGLTGVNMLTFGNVKEPLRRIPHIIVSAAFILVTNYLLWREFRHFVDIRTRWLKSDSASRKSRTVMITNVPKDVFSEAGIKELAASVAAQTSSGLPRPSGISADTHRAPGGVTDVWLARKVKAVETVWQDRDKECNRLEGGVGKLLKLAQKNQLKGKTPEAKGTWNQESANPADQYVLPKKQPKWKQGFLGLFGKKMDLDTSPLYIREKNDELVKLRANEDDYELGNVAFVRFATQDEALNFARLVKKSDRKRFMMVKTSFEVVPDDVIWSNVSINPYQRKARTFVSWALTVTLIIFWTIPMAFVGFVSNVDTLSAWTVNGTKPFSWILKIPAVPLGIIKAVLPSVALAVLFMLLPIVLRAWIKLQGETRKSEVELKLFTRYWLFWIIHGFLIVTLSAGILPALSNISSTLDSIPTLLADQLPGANVFFLVFILTATWSAAAKTLARIVPWVMWQLRGILAGGTPRKAFAQKYNMDSFLWSTTMPNICLIVAVAIIYSTIQPLVTVIGLIGMVLFYSAYKYQLLWTSDQPEEMETGGLYYRKMLRTVFVAMYFQIICLGALFFLMNNTVGYVGGAVIIACGVITAVHQAYLDHVAFKRDVVMYGWTHLYSSSQTHLNPAENVVKEKMPGEKTPPIMDDAAGLTGQDRIDVRHEFDNPAMYKAQPVIWIANDPLGLGNYEANRINADGVDASTEFAHMDAKGKLDVDRSPPDEDWDGGV